MTKNTTGMNFGHQKFNLKITAMKLYNSLLDEFKRQKIGYVSIAIIGQGIIPSIATMLILMSDASKGIILLQLFFVIILCTSFNGAVIVQQKSKVIFNLLLLSVAFSIFIITINSI